MLCVQFAEQSAAPGFQKTVKEKKTYSKQQQQQQQQRTGCYSICH
jgi:hypothetical protein